jgi:radical SAM superfamily enzyme YgiQ (UPF0313 family)
MLVRPPAGYATGNKPNIREGLYLLPQALPYLARVIEKSGCEPVVLDLEVNRGRMSDFLHAFAAISPDVVLFTVSTPSYCYCREMALAIKRNGCQIPIIFGGPHATYQWDAILSAGVADIVVLREGGFAVKQLLDCLLHDKQLDKCGSIAYVDAKGVPRCTADSSLADSFEEFGTPGYEYVDMKAYQQRVGKCTLEIVRGCRIGCKFCLNTKYYPTLRYKPVADLSKELDLLVRHYGFNKISVISPELLSNEAYIISVLDAFTGFLEGTNVTWACATSAMSLTPNLLTKMSRAHCRSLFLGVESGAATVQCVAGDKLQLPALQERLKAIGDIGIGVLASFIIGLPGETEDTALRTIDLAATLREKYKFIKTIQFNTFGPFPGTDFANDSARYGFRVLPIDFAYYPVVPAVESDTFPRELHYRLWHRVWQELFPSYYDEYRAIEAAALAGQNPRLAAFCGD